jgi:DNA-binding NarL/FixJ family response regulator
MLALDQGGPFGLVGELATVAEAAGARLRAETDADAEAASAAAAQLVSAAGAAMGAGHSLSAITQAEARGQEEVRNALRGDMLRSVERTGRRARETRMEHHQTIARAVRLGLSTREIAAAADVTHGTVRAISNRLAAAGGGGRPGDESHDDGERTERDVRETEPVEVGHGDTW